MEKINTDYKRRSYKNLGQMFQDAWGVMLVSFPNEVILYV